MLVGQVKAINCDLYSYIINEMMRHNKKEGWCWPGSEPFQREVLFKGCVSQ